MFYDDDNIYLVCRCWDSAPPEEWGKHETHGDNDRITTSMELAWNPIDWTSHRLSIGMDRGEANDWVLIPRQPEGRSQMSHVLSSLIDVRW